MKLNLEDLQVSTFAPQEDDMQVNSYSLTPSTCRFGSCPSEPGGQLCVTEQYGGAETCETGPVYYC